jgi:hypothetical protein
MLALVGCRWWVAGFLCAVVGAGCGEGSSPSSSSVRAIRTVEAKSHLVAVAYRAFGSAQQDCQDKFNAGVLKTDSEGVSCIDDGLTASKLERAIETLRKEIVSVGQGGAQGCKEASQRLADVVQQEEASIHALHADLARLDAQSFNRDFAAADADAGRETKLVDPLVQACA